MSDEYLVSPMERVPQDREALGIAQTDIILRTAIMAGLEDLRANPDLLDYVFSSLPRDPLTFRDYGEHEVDVAKKWFLSQDIPVMMNTRVDETKVPCVTVSLQSSAEDAPTLGDVHYETVEKGKKPVVYYGPFTPAAYNPMTGIVTMPSSFEGDLFPGMILQDASGQSHEILDVIDAYTFEVKPAVMNLQGARIVSMRGQVVTLESLHFREEFEIGVHVAGEPVYLSYLHSIMVFVLLRYKEALIEGRGLEQTTISSGPVMLNTEFAMGQPVFTRMIRMTGYVRQYWPKYFRAPIEGITEGIQVYGDSGEPAVTIFSDDTAV